MTKKKQKLKIFFGNKAVSLGDNGTLAEEEREQAKEKLNSEAAPDSSDPTIKAVGREVDGDEKDTVEDDENYSEGTPPPLPPEEDEEEEEEEEANENARLAHNNTVPHSSSRAGLMSPDTTTEFTSLSLQNSLYNGGTDFHTTADPSSRNESLPMDTIRRIKIESRLQCTETFNAVNVLISLLDNSPPTVLAVRDMKGAMLALKRTTKDLKAYENAIEVSGVGVCW